MVCNRFVCTLHNIAFNGIVMNKSLFPFIAEEKTNETKQACKQQQQQHLQFNVLCIFYNVTFVMAHVSVYAARIFITLNNVI